MFFKKERKSSTIVTRTHFDTDAIIKKQQSYRIASLDCETNGLAADRSVLCAGCIIYQVDWYDDVYAELTEDSRYARYYFPAEEYDPKAISINGLTKKAIKKHRRGTKYPKFFSGDKSDLLSFLGGCDLIIGYNLKFDLSFIPEIKNLNIPFYCVQGTQKISLVDKAEKEGIGFDRAAAHNAFYDAELTARLYEVQLRDWWRARKSMGRSGG